MHTTTRLLDISTSTKELYPEVSEACVYVSPWTYPGAPGSFFQVNNLLHLFPLFSLKLRIPFRIV